MSEGLSKRFRMKCERLATEKRDELGLLAFEPLSADGLAKAVQVCIKTPLDLTLSEELKSHLSETNTWSGLLLNLNTLTILYNPKQSPARYESTIMHELAHVILKHPPDTLFLSKGRYTRSHTSHVEKEATYLGGCLQIPRRALLWAKQRKMDDEAVAEYFGASLEMVRWRQNAVLFPKSTKA